MSLIIEKNKKYSDFLVFEEDDIKILFSTNEIDRSFNRNTNDGLENLKVLKSEFEVDNVIYLNQIHSDNIINYKGENIEEFITKEGDGILTNITNLGIGVFSADCVPIIAIDKNKKVIGAVHSGWKGTYNSIIVNLIRDMVSKYSSNIEDIKIYIGPHIRQCCYEVSEELKEKFIESRESEIENLFESRNLSMELYIKNDLLNVGIKEENIYSINLCTRCSKEIKLHSHRGSNGGDGRMISVVYIK